MNRTRNLASLAAIAILQITPSLIAQQPVFRANIPFAFSVDNKILPAGVYRISRRDAFLRIEGDTAEFYVTMFAANPSPDGRTLLLFDRVNGNNFLRELVTSSSDSCMQLPASSSEKKARAQWGLSTSGPTLDALNAPGTVTIEIPSGGR